MPGHHLHKFSMNEVDLHNPRYLWDSCLHLWSQTACIQISALPQTSNVNFGSELASPPPTVPQQGNLSPVEMVFEKVIFQFFLLKNRDYKRTDSQGCNMGKYQPRLSWFLSKIFCLPLCNWKRSKIGMLLNVHKWLYKFLKGKLYLRRYFTATTQQRRQLILFLRKYLRASQLLVFQTRASHRKDNSIEVASSGKKPLLILSLTHTPRPLLT